MKTFYDYITEASLTPADLKKRDVYKARVTQHKADLKSAGWKKSHELQHTGGSVHVYHHPERTGHEIHMDPKTGSFEHKVNFGAEHKQKGKAAAGMSELAKHLDAHSRHTQYDHDRKPSGQSWDRSRDGYSSSPNPRGPGG
jgi:hypothetical protein